MLENILKIFLAEGIKAFDFDLISQKLNISKSEITSEYSDYKNLVKDCLVLQISNDLKAQMDNQKKYDDSVEAMYYATILGLESPNYQLFFNEVTEVYPDLFKEHIENYQKQLVYISEYYDNLGIEKGYVNMNVNRYLLHSIYIHMYMKINSFTSLRNFFNEKKIIMEFNLIFLMSVQKPIGQRKLLEIKDMDKMRYL